MLPFAFLARDQESAEVTTAPDMSAEATTMDVLEMCTHEVTDEDDGVGSSGDGESGGDGDGEVGSGGGGDGDDGGDRLAQETRVCIADAYRRASRGKGRATPYPDVGLALNFRACTHIFLERRSASPPADFWKSFRKFPHTHSHKFSAQPMRGA